MNLDAILNYTGEGPPSLDHEANMALSPAELELALRIKEAVEAEAALTNLTDYDYVQHALAAKGDSLEVTLAKVETMQSFRQEYHLVGSVEEAMDVLDKFTQHHPGFLLAIDYQPYDGNFHIVYDAAACLPSSINTLEQIRVFMAGLYYQYNIANATFRAIRTGITNITESEGLTFDRNFDAHMIQKLVSELFQPYPTLLRDVHFLHSQTVVNVMCALVKASLPKHMTDAFRLGCHSHPHIFGVEGTRLDELFLTPNPETARRAMLQKIEGYLNVRARHQLQFTLPPR